MKKMKKMLEKIHRGTLALAASAMFLLAAPMLSSCSDDDDVVKTPLSTTNITEGAKTVSSLNFSWQPIEGATQYAYELKEKASGTYVLGGITNTTSLLATNLKVNTTYEMSVWAYAALSSDKTTSERITILATTNDVVPLATPADITSEWGAGIITITWQAVPNAWGYEYSYEKNGETVTGYVEENVLSIAGLPVGEYTVFLRAVTDNENYSDSETISFTFIREKTEIWRKECNYNAPLFGTDFTCQVVAFDDGNFEIQGLYGSDDALEFNADENGELLVLNGYDVQPPYYYVSAGDYTLCIYIATGSSSVVCSESFGEIWFYTYLYDKDGNYLGGDYNYITWGNAEAEPDPADALVGDYTETTNCYDFSIDWTNWIEITDQKNDVKIEKVDANTISLYNFYGAEDTFIGTVDAEAKTITFQIKEDWGGYYTFCQYDSPSVPVVGEIADDGSITISNWTMWYAPSNYSYIYSDAKSVLVKK